MKIPRRNLRCNRLTAAQLHYFLLDPRRTPLRSRRAGDRHCSLALAKARRQGLNPRRLGEIA